MIRSLIASLTRHALTILAGTDIATSFMANDQPDLITSGILIGAALLWSFLDKSKAPRPIVHQGYNN